MPETTRKRSSASKPSLSTGNLPDATIVSCRPSKEALIAEGKQYVAPTAKIGKPSKYTHEIARIICEELSEGVPLRQICRENDGFPAWRTVYDWMKKDDDLLACGTGGVGLSASISRARDIGYDAMAEECLQIADCTMPGEITTVDGDKVIIRKEDMLGHRKLRIETRLKLLAKFHPTKYGDRVAIEGVEGGAPIGTVDLSTSYLADVIKNLEMKKRAD